MNVSVSQWMRMHALYMRMCVAMRTTPSSNDYYSYYDNHLDVPHSTCGMVFRAMCEFRLDCDICVDALLESHLILWLAHKDIASMGI